ncbi:MAG TPA: glycosyltransferase [Rhodanobacteraceae bacterium]
MDTAKRRIRVLAVASRYPNDDRPTRGLVIEERLRALAGSGRIVTNVVSPVPWFPWRSERFGRWSAYARTPVRERRFGIVVDHPSYLVLPGVGRAHSATTLSRVLLALLQQRRRQGADFDLIEAHGLFPDGVAAVRAAVALGKPCVVCVRGGDPWLNVRTGSLRNRIAVALAHANAVIASSNAVQRQLLAIGARPDATHVLPPGVDTVRFRMLGHHTVKLKLRLAGDIWLAVGTLARGKGFDTIIAALGQVPAATLFVLGAGPDEKRLRTLAGRVGVEARIHFMGATAHNELPRYYNAADALIDASNGPDVPNAVLEALACGTPVVATPGAGLREALAPPAAVVIAATPDAAGLAAAWRHLIAHPPERNATRALAETLGWDKAVDGICDVYAGVLAASAVKLPADGVVR